MLRQRTACFLWRHGMARQHKWCKHFSLSSSSLLSSFFHPHFDVYWHRSDWGCHIDISHGWKMWGGEKKKKASSRVFIEQKMSFTASTWISLRNMTDISVLIWASICHRAVLREGRRWSIKHWENRFMYRGNIHVCIGCQNDKISLSTVFMCEQRLWTPSDWSILV